MDTPSGAPRPGSWLAPGPAAGGPATEGLATEGLATEGLAARLAELPVSGHADLLTAEHDRLHRLLATIDQL